MREVSETGDDSILAGGLEVGGAMTAKWWHFPLRHVIAY